MGEDAPPAPAGPHRPARPAAGRVRAGWAPGLASLRAYDRSWLRGDVVAGVVVAAYLVPQCMAYAEVAGLPPVTGLWAMLPPIVLYAVLGSSRQLSVGPETTTALLTASAVAPLAAGDPAKYAALAAAAALVVGVLLLLGALLRLGVLANLLGRPILVGYMTGVALIMIVGQLGKVTGVPVEGDGFGPELRSFLTQLDQIELPTLLLATGVLVALVALDRWAPRWPGPLIAVLGATAAVVVLGLESRGVSVVGTVPSGLPTPGWPDVSPGDLGALVPAAAGIALVGFSDNVLTARAFAARHNQHVDPDAELRALGVANLGTGLFQGFPISSSGSRTALADGQGASSQAYSLVAGVVLLAVLFVLGPLLENFPNAALGALVVYAALKLIDLPEFRRLLGFRRSEFAIALATMIGVLWFGLLVGVLVAIALSAVDLVARLADPHDAVLGRVDRLGGWHDVDDFPEARPVGGVVVYRYDAPLFFANVEDFRERSHAAVQDELDVGRPVGWFVLQCEAINRIDSTGADALVDLHRWLSVRGVTLACCEVKQELLDQLRRAGLLELIGPDRLFPTIEAAVEAAGRGGPAAGRHPADP